MRLWKRAEPRHPTQINCWASGCGKMADMYVETDDLNYPLCRGCYETSIRRAQHDNPHMDPEVVRSCMERASYPVRQ